MKLDKCINVSKHLLYHLHKDISIANNIFRYGSESWASLIREARKHYLEGNVCELDYEEYDMVSCDIGEIGMFEGKEVLIDTPNKVWTKDNIMEVFIKKNNDIIRIEFEQI